MNDSERWLVRCGNLSFVYVCVCVVNASHVPVFLCIVGVAWI